MTPLIVGACGAVAGWVLLAAAPRRARWLCLPAFAVAIVAAIAGGALS